MDGNQGMGVLGMCGGGWAKQEDVRVDDGRTTSLAGKEGGPSCSWKAQELPHNAHSVHLVHIVHLIPVSLFVLRPRLREPFLSIQQEPLSFSKSGSFLTLPLETGGRASRPSESKGLVGSFTRYPAPSRCPMHAGGLNCTAEMRNVLFTW